MTSRDDSGTDPLPALAQGTTEALATRYDTALVDLDGVVYVGAHAVPGAPAALAAARELGMRTAFVTNNASRTPATVAAHLTELGVEAREDSVVTSAQAAATLVAGQVPSGASVLVVGGDGLDAALRERGLRPVRSADDDPAAVVQGYGPDVGWALLAEGTFAVRRGLPWIASNMDSTVPTPRGLAPGNGALVDVIRGTTGRDPVVAGKPEPPLHHEAVRRTGARRALVVGDRLDTDIEGAQRVDADSLLVLTGVATAAELVGAAPHQRPTFLAADLDAGLLHPHPAVTETGTRRWSCGGWTASLDDGALRLTGSGERVDALRALCVAAWSAPSPPDVADTLSRAGFADP